MYSGRVYCAAFASGTTITSNEAVVATGAFGTYLVGDSQVVISINNLQAVVQYTTYCVVRTGGGVASLLADTVDTRQDIETACCKLISYRNAPKFVYGSLTKYTAAPSIQYVFTYVLSSAPEVGVVVTPSVFDTLGNPVANAVIAPTPASHEFTASSTTLEGSFVLFGATAPSGTYTIQLLRSGASADQYDDVAITVSILDSASAPPAPTMSTAKFANSGAYIEVTFDSATNKAGFASASFRCSNLFTFLGAESTTCSWTSASVARIQLSAAPYGTSLIVPTSDITLLEGKVKAACPTGTDCSAYVAAESHLVTTVVPDAPIVPTVVLQVPTIAASCDDVLVDATLSSGTGGRPWTSVVWQAYRQVSTTPVLNAEITSTLQSHGTSTSEVIPISKSVLISAIYTITLKVTNFLGQSSSASASFTVDFNPNLPIVKILGPPDVTMVPNEALQIYTAVAQASCAETAATITYRWKVYENDVLITSHPSLSRDPARYRLAPYSLTIQSVYRFVLEATARATPSFASITSTTSVTVRVSKGAIVAVVTGGSYRSLASASPFTLDASASYDQSYPAGASLTVLSYAWSCRILTVDRYGESCAALLPAARTSAQIKLGVVPLSVGIVYEFLVTVSASDGRSNSFAVAVQNSAGSTLTSINNAVLSKVNPSKRLALTGFVTGDYALDCSWAAYIDGVAQSFVAASPLSGSFSRSEVVNTLAYPLSVPPSTFKPGSTVVFRLTAHAAGNSNLYPSYSDITIEMNAPPSGGSMTLDRTTGVALSDVFTMSASNWDDDAEDLPLTYEFTYKVMASQPALTLQSRTSSNRVSTTLPAGPSTQNNHVTLLCNVYDAYLSVATVSEVVTVTQSVSVDVSNYIDGAIAASAASGNADTVSQAIANAATTVNEVTCSAADADYCADLNRGACFRTPQTCSSCLTGFTGVLGDSNAPCRNVTDAPLASVGESCSTNADCELFSCVDGTCMTPLRTCPSTTAGECSDHGECVYLDNNGQDFGRLCDMSDGTCTAMCQCASGYGGASCSLTDGELSARDSTRAKLCTAIVSVSSGSDISYQLLDTLISALYSAYDPFEVVSEDAQTVCYEALTLLTDFAQDGYLSEESTRTVVETTSKYLRATTHNDNRRMLSSASSLVASGGGNALDSATSGIIVGVLKNMAPGQTPLAFANDEIQVIVIKGLVSDIASLAPPQSEAASTYGSRPTSYLELTNTTAQLLRRSGAYVEASVLIWGVNPFPGSEHLQSPLLRVELYSLELSADDVAPDANSTEPAFYIVIQFSTRQNFNLSLTIDEAIALGTPNFTIPLCENYDGSAYVPSPCEVDTYTNDNVTFACPMVVFAATSNRRLQSGNSTTTMQFGSSLGDLDVRHHHSKNPFANLDNPKIVIIFLSVLSFVVLLGYVVLWRWDVADKEFILQEQAEEERQKFLVRHSHLLDVQRSNRNESIDWFYTEPRARSGSHSKVAAPVPSGDQVEYKAPATALAAHSKSNSGSSDGKSSLKLVQIYTPSEAESDVFSLHHAFSTQDSFSSASLTPTAPSPHPFDRSLSKSSEQSDQPDQPPGSGTPPKHVKFNFSDALVKSDVSWEDEFYASNRVSDYLTTVWPRDSLSGANSTWTGFLRTVWRMHRFTTIFHGRSLHHTRVVRWTSFCVSVLATLFIETLIYGIIYPDTGECGSHDSESSCTAEQSLVFSASLCEWSASDADCTVRPPPHYFVFIIGVVAATALIVIPIQLAYDYLIFSVCASRPRWVDWGFAGDSTIATAENLSLQAIREDMRAKSAHKSPSTKDAESAVLSTVVEETPDATGLVGGLAYEGISPCAQEADELLVAAKAEVERRYNGTEMPWKSTDPLSRVTNVPALQQQLGMSVDGQPARLTTLDWIRYGSSKNKLTDQIASARAGATAIRQQFSAVPTSDHYGQDKMLLQLFVLEQFGSLHQFFLRTYLLDNADTTPQYVSPMLWIVTWLFVLLSLAFFLVVSFYWAITLDEGVTVETWGINFGSTVAQEMLVIQVLRAYFLYTVTLSTIQPQLQQIYRVLHRRAVAFAQDLLETPLGASVVQHLSPACRAAHTSTCSNMAAALVLKHITDHDALACRTPATKHSSWSFGPFGGSIFTNALFIWVLESTFPVIFDRLLVANYYFYRDAGLFILLPYLVLIALYVWQQTAHKSLLQRAQESSRSALAISSADAAATDIPTNGAKHWNSSHRSIARNRSIGTLISSAYASCVGHRADDAAVVTQWKVANKPATLTAAAPSKAAPKRRRKKGAAAKPMCIPDEVLEIIVDGGIDWREAWEGARVSRVQGYLNPNAAPASTVSPDSMEQGEAAERRRLSAGSEFRKSFSFFSGTDKLMDSVLHKYRVHVQAGRMKLVDATEMDHLLAHAASQCNVLVEFSDLQVLLHEILSEVHPFGQTLTAVERNSVVASCYEWIADLGEDLVVEHYNHDLSRIPPAALHRTASFGLSALSIPEPVSTTSPLMSQVSVGLTNGQVNYCVPFQEFRRWARSPQGISEYEA